MKDVIVTQQYGFNRESNSTISFHAHAHLGKIRCHINSLNTLPLMLASNDIKNINAKIEKGMANRPSSG